MHNIVLFDDPVLREQLLPLTYTRPVALLRCGIHTIADKWQHFQKSNISFLTKDYLAGKFPATMSADHVFVNGSLCATDELWRAITALEIGSALVSPDHEILALRSGNWSPAQGLGNLKRITYTLPFTLIRHVWDIFLQNGAEIKADFARIKASGTSRKIADPFTRCYQPDQIFIEEGAILKACILNAENGPIYIGKNALIQEGSMVQGPFAIGDNSVLAQGTKIRPNTTIGPFCKVGGEVSNSILTGYSNKGHDGYLGNSVIGEWCNLGANTNNSNLKNDHTNVKLHSYVTDSLADTGLTFCGLIMGDYSKAGISTMFNTGTVVGVSANIFGAGFQAKHIPSFSWGGQAEGTAEYRFQKALEVATDTAGRRGIHLTETDTAILSSVFEQTSAQRAD